MKMKNSEKLKIWFRKNWGTFLLVVFFIVIIVNPDAKAWLMRQIISTGLLNSNIETKNTEKNNGQTREEIPENIKEQLIVELYSK